MKNNYWTEPEQLDKTSWIVKKYDINNNKIDEKISKSKQDAWTFLKTTNYYINDKLVYSST